MVGQKSYQRLRNLGLDTIGTLAEMPQTMLIRVLGENGKVIWERANGIDNTPIIPYTEQKSISTEQTFLQDTIDIHLIKSILINMVVDLCYQLRKQHKLSACIAVKIRYSNFDTESKQRVIAYTSSDHTLITIALDLFEKLYQRRMLIRLIGVNLSHLVHGTEQLNMFEDRIELQQLYRAMDKIKHRYGSHSVLRASAVDMSRFSR